MGASWAAFVDGWVLFRDPVLAGAIAGLALGVAGVLVAMLRLGFLAAAMGQAAGLGVAVAFLLEGWGLAAWPRLGAVGGALLAALAGGWARPAARDGLLAWVFVASAALSLLVGSRLRQDLHDVQALLMGTAVVVLPEDLAALGLTGALLLAYCLGLRRLLSVAVLDPDGLRSQGGQPAWVVGGFLALLALCVAVATKALGAWPAFALAALPGWGAVRLGRSPFAAMALAGGAGAAAGAGGYVLAFLGGFPVGPCQAALAAALALAMRGLGRAFG